MITALVIALAGVSVMTAMALHIIDRRILLRLDNLLSPFTAAHMQALIADYGYLLPEEDSSTWGGDAHLKQPLDLLIWLQTRAQA